MFLFYCADEGRPGRMYRYVKNFLPGAHFSVVKCENKKFFKKIKKSVDKKNKLWYYISVEREGNHQKVAKKTLKKVKKLLTSSTKCAIIIKEGKGSNLKTGAPTRADKSSQAVCYFRPHGSLVVGVYKCEPEPSG